MTGLNVSIFITIQNSQPSILVKIDS